LAATRTLIFAAAGAVLAASLAYGAGQPEGKRVQPRVCLTQRLELTEAQKKQIEGICTKYRGEMKKLREGKGDRQQGREQARELRRKMRAEIHRVLTPAQREKLQSYRSEWRKGALRDRGLRRGQAMMDRMTRELALTPAQREKVREVYRAHREEIRALAKDVRAQGGDRQQLRQRAQALREKLVAGVRAELTPQQQQKLQALVRRWERGPRG
jgi:Spy/CpxP family protein refolding chaperone